MDPVADQIGVEIAVFEHGADHAGLAMVERPHGVVGVGRGGCAGCDAAEGLGVGRVGVSQADPDPEASRVTHEIERAGKLGGDGHQLDVPARGLLVAVEERYGGLLEQGDGVGSALGVREEGAFEVDPDGSRLVVWGGGLDGGCEAGEGGQEVVVGGCDGGGKVVAGALAGEETRDGRDAVGRGPHEVLAGRAVDVNVEKGRGQDGGRPDRWVGGDVLNEAVRRGGDDGVFDGADGGDEGTGGEGGHCG